MIDLSQETAFRARTGYLFLAVMLGHLILISAQVQAKSGVPVLEAVTFGVFSRIQNATASVLGGIRGGWANNVDLRGVRAQNEDLQKRLADLEVRLQEHRALAARSLRLQELLDLRSSTPLPTIAAEVIGGNPNPGMLTITIDRGTADGVQADMAVIAPRGIVGRVVAPVASRAARVQLIIDRTAALGALVERTRAGGIVVGTGDDPPLRMEMVSNLSDVEAGDLVISSGVDGIYPRGFTIGTVESSERGPGLHRLITVRPAIDFSGIEEVLVVLVPPRGATPEDPEETPNVGGK